MNIRDLVVPDSNSGVPILFVQPSDDKQPLNSNYTYNNSKNYTHDLILKFLYGSEFLDYIKIKYQTQHSFIQISSYFKKHLQNKSFEKPIKLYEYILNKQKGIKNLITTVELTEDGKRLK